MPAAICLVHDDVSEQERPYLFALSVHCPVVKCHWRKREKLARHIAMPWLIDMRHLNAEVVEALQPFTIPPRIGRRLVAVDSDRRIAPDQPESWGPMIVVLRPVEATMILRLAEVCRPEPSVRPHPAKSHPPLMHFPIGDVVRDAAAILDLVSQAVDEGRRISSDDWQAAVPAVITAIGEQGLGAWLDLVREHHVGTYQHSLLVMGIAAELGQTLGLPKSKVEQLALGGLLHDVGKFEVPQAILDKPGRLTTDEFDVMRRHPRDGWSALRSTVPSLDPVILEMVLDHHEQPDGGGYPDGLSGDRISPMVRMLTVADVFGALLERRPYRPPLPPRNALEIMWAMANKSKLDPNFVRAAADLDVEPIVGRSADLPRNRYRR